MNILNKPKLHAFSLIEVTLATAILAIIFSASYSVFNISLQAAELARQRTLAQLQAYDLLELTVSKRNEDWNSLQIGEWHFEQDPVSGTQFVAGSETDGEFTRKVVIAPAYRDGSNNIVSTPGTLDSDVMLITATVEWTYAGQPDSLQLSRILTNWKKF